MIKRPLTAALVLALGFVCVPASTAAAPIVQTLTVDFSPNASYASVWAGGPQGLYSHDDLPPPVGDGNYVGFPFAQFDLVIDVGPVTPPASLADYDDGTIVLEDFRLPKPSVILGQEIDLGLGLDLSGLPDTSVAVDLTGFLKQIGPDLYEVLFEPVTIYWSINSSSFQSGAFSVRYGTEPVTMTPSDCTGLSEDQTRPDPSGQASAPLDLDFTGGATFLQLVAFTCDTDNVDGLARLTTMAGADDLPFDAGLGGFVPEPGSLLLVGSGLLGLAISGRRRA